MVPRDSAPSKPPFNGMNISTVAQKLTPLPIVPVVIRSQNNKTFKTYALLDCASEVTLLREDATKCLTGPVELLEISSWHAQDPKSCRVSFSMKSTDGRSVLQISDAYSVPRLHLSKR
jgi:hypothetical protein